MTKKDEEEMLRGNVIQILFVMGVFGLLTVIHLCFMVS